MAKKDIQCPYCEYWQGINHDDGAGYEEDELHRQECPSCNKIFTFTTGIIYVYTAYAADCLNGGEHEWIKTNTYPRRFTKWKCRLCEETKPLSLDEMIEVIKNDASA